MDIEERMRLITRNTQEIVTPEELRKLLETKKQPAVYLGTAITGRPHVAYFLWVLKLADFLKAGFKVKVLLADLHGALDNTPWDVLEKRYRYYEKLIPALFQAVGADVKNIEMVKGSSYQKSEAYFFDLLKLATLSSVHDAKKAGSEVVKQSENPRLSGLLYPLMQALDEEHLQVDVKYGGADQRKILMFAREHLPKLGYKARVEFMTPIVPGLIGEKMSSSHEESKIDCLDAPDVVKKKLSKAFCPEGSVEGNGVMSFLKHVVFVMKEDKKESFVIERPEKYGGTVRYKAYADLEKDFIAKNVHPMDVKNALANEINTLLEPVRKAMPEKLVRGAYP